MNGRRFPPAGRLALAAAVLALAGCPYESDFPIGSPADAVADAALVGTWKNSQEGEVFSLTILAEGEAGYRLEAESDDDKETATLRGFVSLIDGESFLSLLEIPSAPKEVWSLLNYQVDGDRLRLRLVDDALFEGKSFTSAKELRDFIRENLEDPRLYGDEAGSGWDWELERTLP